MARMQPHFARLVHNLHCCVDSDAALTMTCCAAGIGGKRQIGADRQNGKLEQQLVLLVAAVMRAKQLAAVEATVVAVVMQMQEGQEPVLSAWKMIATQCSRRVGICALAVPALSALIDALFVEQEAEPSECIAPSFTL